MDLLHLALIVAEQRHQGQLYNKEPYINHPKRVADRLTDETDKVVALLHDTVEDTGLSLTDICISFGGNITDAVDAITRRDNEKYFDYIRRVATNPIALRVKIADLLENLYQSSTLTESLQSRYMKALDMLYAIHYKSNHEGEQPC